MMRRNLERKRMLCDLLPLAEYSSPIFCPSHASPTSTTGHNGCCGFIYRKLVLKKLSHKHLLGTFGKWEKSNWRQHQNICTYFSHGRPHLYPFNTVPILQMRKEVLRVHMFPKLDKHE